MLDWIIVAVGGGLLAAGCAVGSMVTKVLQRLLGSRRAQKDSIKAAVAREDAEANRETQSGVAGGGCGDGMEDLLFDEKLKLLVLKENLKKKLYQQKKLIQQLMGGNSASAAVEMSSTKPSVQVGAAGDLEVGSSDGTGRKASERKAKQDAEAEFFAAELELSNWQN